MITRSRFGGGYDRRISPKQIKALGWERLTPAKWGKCAQQWQHRDGWYLEHCGHPTANYPWTLYDPQGNMHCTGGWEGQPRNGVAWMTLGDAMTYVASVIRGRNESQSQ